MINCSIVGATGYTGETLVEILLKHPGIKIKNLYAKIDKSMPFCEIFPRFNGRINNLCKPLNIKELDATSDIIFLALPHSISMNIIRKINSKGKIIIDLSADYRLKDPNNYKKHYGTSHIDKKNLSAAIYGIPELSRKKIKKAKIIANPGCYPTATILGLAPVISKGNLIDTKSIIIDAKTGFTGAGRNPKPNLIFSEINEDIKPYKVNSHQHVPEMEQELNSISKKKIALTFVPHLIPIDKGIICTIYVKLLKSTTQKQLEDLYKTFYKNEKFVRVLKKGLIPSSKNVLNTNFCDIGLHVDNKKKQVIIISAIDNLLKGAAGQAVQNMNIMCGFKETTALL